jgi:hypothetical protein
MKAQAESQIFVYILTIIIVGLILLFGIKYISKILDQHEKLELIEFKSNIENSFSKTKCFECHTVTTFSVPKKIKKVCFLDVKTSDTQKDTTSICDKSNSSTYNFYICDAWKTQGFNMNVLTYPMLDTPINVGLINLENQAALCFDTSKNKALTLNLTGEGDKILVERN